MHIRSDRSLVLGWLLLACAVPASAAQDQFFDSNGVKLRYRVEGQGEPVLLIHGFGANEGLQWDLPGVTRKLANEYRVIAYDNRGHGRSGKPHEREKYGTEMIGDAVRLLDHLEIDRAHVVGYSMGAFIAGKLVVTHPDRVISVTLGGAGWHHDDDQRAAIRKQVADSLDSGQGIGPLLDLLTPIGQPKRTPRQLKIINAAFSFVNDVEALAAVFRAMDKFDVKEDELKANRVPALAIVGEKDPLKVTVDELVGVMTELKVVVVADAGHMSCVFRPEFIASIRAFLAEHPAAQPAETR
jgi:pimeloyl-ACP methyl ester carboxylesterase